MTMITDLPPCPVETTLLLISDKWVVLILRDLMTGTKRFNELMRSVTGVSQKVLTEKLRRMEENGLVIRTVYSEIPPRETWGNGYKELVRRSEEDCRSPSGSS